MDVDENLMILFRQILFYIVDFLAKEIYKLSVIHCLSPEYRRDIPEELRIL